MYFKMPRSTKPELIMMLLNQWDPTHGADKDFRFCQVEAEEIAQQIRKNSKQESVEKAVRICFSVSVKQSDVADVNEKIEYMRRALKKWLEE